MPIESQEPVAPCGMNAVPDAATRSQLSPWDSLIRSSDCTKPELVWKKDGEADLREKVEVKNLNSFKAVRLACDYEYERQAALWESGQAVAPETRSWDGKRTALTRVTGGATQGCFHCHLPPPTSLSDHNRGLKNHASTLRETVEER